MGWLTVKVAFLKASLLVQEQQYARQRSATGERQYQRQQKEPQVSRAPSDITFGKQHLGNQAKTRIVHRCNLDPPLHTSNWQSYGLITRTTPGELRHFVIRASRLPFGGMG